MILEDQQFTLFNFRCTFWKYEFRQLSVADSVDTTCQDKGRLGFNEIYQEG